MLEKRKIGRYDKKTLVLHGHLLCIMGSETMHCFFSLWVSVTILWKATEQYFHVMLFVFGLETVVSVLFTITCTR